MEKNFGLSAYFSARPPVGSKHAQPAGALKNKWANIIKKYGFFANLFS